MRFVTLFFVVILAVTIPAFPEVTLNQETVISLSVFVPCAVGGEGEFVDLRGRLHTLISATVNNNHVSGYFHIQPQGIDGVGEVSGVKYQGTGDTLDSFHTSLQNGHADLTFVNNFRIIGQGPGNDFLVHETLHIAINADGTMTATHDNFSSECM
jgi:hypothetical protein